MLTSLLAIPSTALAHPAVAAGATGGVGGLREAIRGLLSSVSPDGAVVVVAGDPAAGLEPVGLIPDGGVVHLGGLGLPTLRASVGAPPHGLETAATHPGADLSVLAVLVAHHRPAAALSAVGLPAGRVERADVGAVVSPVLVALVDGPENLTVVVAGDLAAGHGPKPPRPDAGPERAAAFDAAVGAALDDPAALTALAAEAVVCGARGLPALGLAATLAGRMGWSASGVEIHRTAGVGGITARWS